VRGRVRFSENSRASSVKVGLSLIAQQAAKPMAPGRIDADTPIAGCSTTVEREAADASFVLPLPLVAASYAGSAFRVGVGVVATADDGSTIRTLLDVPPAGDEARLVLRGLPLKKPLASPDRFAMGILLALSGALVVALNAGKAEWAYALGGLAAAVGIVLAAIFRRGMLGLFAVGSATIELQVGSDKSELAIAIRGGPRIAAGRVRVAAIEYEVFEGARFEHREIASREARLEAREGGGWFARVALPPAREAPPALALRAPKRLLSIRWLAKIELESRGGITARAAFPIHVGIEPIERDAAEG